MRIDLHHVHWKRTVLGRTVAQRPIRTCTPGPSVTVCIDRNHSSAGCSYRYNASKIITRGGAFLDARRNISRYRGAVAQAPVPASTPGPNLASRLDGRLNSCTYGDGALAASLRNCDQK